MRRTAWVLLGAVALHGCTAAPPGENAHNIVDQPDSKAVEDDLLRTAVKLPAGFSKNPEEDARRAFGTSRVTLLDVGIEVSHTPGWDDTKANPGQCGQRLTARTVPELATDAVFDSSLHLAGMRYVVRYNRELRRLCANAAH